MPTTSIPVVAIDPHTGPGGPSTIDSDNVGGARTATRHLLELGHRRIAHIRGRSDLASARTARGRLPRIARRGRRPVRPIPSSVRDGGYQAALTADAARELLTRPDRPTAVFAANDMSAIGVTAVARELGLRVPEDLSVIGFDDMPESARSTPPLTTLAQPLHDLGAQALRMLIELLDGKEVPSHVQLPAELIVRSEHGSGLRTPRRRSPHPLCPQFRGPRHSRHSRTHERLIR